MAKPMLYLWSFLVQVDAEAKEQGSGCESDDSSYDKSFSHYYVEDQKKSFLLALYRDTDARLRQRHEEDQRLEKAAAHAKKQKFEPDPYRRTTSRLLDAFWKHQLSAEVAK
jgi:TfoX/Sxy family transcriptional regulator of competence genes